MDRLHARAFCLSVIEKLGTARSTIMPGYTHLQPAQTITSGYYLTNVSGALERENERFKEYFKRINLCRLGVAAMAGTTFAISRSLTAELLGFDGIVAHCLDTVGWRDFVIGTLSMLSRVAQDLYVFCTNEFSALSFPDHVAGTSSIMPKKKNMLALECFRATPGRIIGALIGS
ncbi:MULTISPECIES: lyase family protein [Rhizobium/Agrobacterium group]|uniref:lyase family protein n=1 Tax=Rhizobium/Agrobacterium group TaxID=227290 RepID=UPI001ADC60AB|nr:MULTISPECIES: lyase family protein [Rhizobium/Agrobacterium group]MBO9112656.1 hypothetical protein [Agrobacterium sp. S2/73]